MMDSLRRVETDTDKGNVYGAGQSYLIREFSGSNLRSK